MRKVILVLVLLISSSFCFADAEFIRGDANRDEQSRVDMSDAIFILQALFVPGSPLPKCFDSADVNDSGEITISDAIYILLYEFCDGPPPPLPFPEKGMDPTEDELFCNS